MERLNNTHTRHTGTARAIALVCAAALIASVVAVIPARPAAAADVPAPAASINVESRPMIGETVPATVVFSNTSATAVGYGPYVNVFIDTTGADGDDGLTVTGGTYLGSPVPYTDVALTCIDDVHPLTGLPVVCPTGFAAGDMLRVFELPFGSYTPDQPDTHIEMSVEVSSFADLDVPLPIVAEGGFRYGATPLDDPDVDPPIVQATPHVATLTPMVVELDKHNNAPEDETATGENYKRVWTAQARVAPGQTITDATLIDRLDNTVAFGGLTTVAPAADATDVPATPGPHNPGDNIVSASWDELTGDAELGFEFWIPEHDADSNPVLDPATGAARIIDNNVSFTGTWVPLDPRDDPVAINVDPEGPEDRLVARSVATQKRVDLVNDVGGSGATPGDTLRWTIDVQISDYFSFDNLDLTDELSDGQAGVFASTPTMSTSHTPDIALPIGTLFVPTDQNCAASNAGGTNITAHLSDALEAQTGSGIWVGNRGGQAETATVTFMSDIAATWTCPSGASAVNSNDTISNTVVVAGDLAGTSTEVTDNSAAHVTVVAPSVTKSVYAVNGQIVSGPIDIAPGDLLTYRVTAALPITNAFNTSVTDFLPLPTFRIPAAGFSTNFATNMAPGAFTPTPWSVMRGPTDTFTDAATAAGAGAPTVSVDDTNNSLTVAYSDLQTTPGNTSETIDLLITAVASDARFADGLLLTNQASLSYADSQSDADNAEAIAQVTLTEPRLSITKGIVATNSPSATFDPAAVGPTGVTWSAPGTAGTRFTPSALTSASLEAAPIRSDMSGGEAGDIVTYAVVVTNTGRSANGAFDVTVTDTLGSGLSEPAGGWNLRVTNGAGTPIGYTTAPGAGPFGAGLVLDDTATGSLGAPAADGSDIAVITFDAVLDADVTFASDLDNTAEITRYSGTEGGPNFLTGELRDDAVVTVAAPDTAKVITDTYMYPSTEPGVPSTPDVPQRSELTIGSQLTYELTMDVPRGVGENLVLRDVLDSGLAVVSISGVTATAGLSTDRVGGWDGVTGAVIGGFATVFALGNVTNSNPDPAAVETVTVEVTAVVLNVEANRWTPTRSLRNTSTVLSGTTQIAPTQYSPAVVVAEPRVTTTKTADVDTADAHDEITYTVVVRHPAGDRTASAMNVTLTDPLPPGVTYVPGSVTVSGTTPTTHAVTDHLSATWTTLAPNQSTTFTYRVTVDSDATSHGGEVVNTATTTWTSQPDLAPSSSPHSTLGVARTGDVTDPGGSANTYLSDDSVTVDINNTTITKRVVGTDQPHTTGTQVAVGETVTYELEVTLPEGDLGQVTVTDTLPVGMTYVTGSAVVDDSAIAGSLGTTTVTTAGNNVVVTLSDVSLTPSEGSNNTTFTITLSAVVANSAANIAGTVLTNSSHAMVVGERHNSNDVTVTVVEPDINITKTASPTTGAVGDDITYTFNVTNTGTAAAFDIAVTDPVDADVLTGLTAGTAPAGWTTALDPATSTWTWTGSQLNPGDKATMTFTGTIADTITWPGSYTNTGSVTAFSTPGTNPERKQYDDNDDATITYTAVDIAVNKTSDVTTAEPGDDITWTVEVTNEGTRDADGVQITDTLGDHVTFVSASHSGVYDAATRTITWPAVSIAAGSGVERHVVTSVNDTLPVGAAGTTNTADAHDDGSHGPDTNPDNNNDDAGVTFGAQPDIAVTKTADVATVAPGGEITWTVEVTNVGNRDANNVVVTDTVGDHLTLTAASGGATIDQAAGTAEWTIAHLSGGGGTVTFTVTTSVDGPVPAGTLVVDNTVDAVHPDDENPTNDTYTDTVDVDGVVDMWVHKTNEAGTVLAGLDFTYLIDAGNSGDRGASGVVVTDPLPDEVTFRAANLGGTYDPVAHTVTWNVGVIEAGDAVGLTVDVTADDPLPAGVTEVTNIASVTDDGLNGPDANPDNNTDDVTNVVGADLGVTKTVVDAPVAGDSVTYEIVVTNYGPEHVTEFTLDEQPGAGLSDLTYEVDQGDFDDVTMLWTGSLPVDGTVTFTVAADVAIDVDEVTNTVSVNPVGHTDRNPDNDTSTVTSPTNDVVTLSFSKDVVGELTAGGEGVYRFTVTNHGPSYARDLVVTDHLPDGLTYQSWSGEDWVCTDADPVRCEYGGPLDVGETTSFDLTVSVATDVAGEVINIATLDGPGAGATAVDSAGTTVEPYPVDPPTPNGPDVSTPPSDTGDGGAPAEDLPRTGANTQVLLLLALLGIAAGVALWATSVLTRRFNNPPVQ